MHVRITCEGTSPLILHEYTVRELLSMWDGSMPLRDHAEGTIYLDGDRNAAIPRAVIQSVLTRSARVSGIALTPKRRLVPGLRMIAPFATIVDRQGRPVKPAVDPRTGDGRRGFRRVSSITCVLPRFDRWRFVVDVELGDAIDWRAARRIWDTAGRFGLGDGSPKLGRFVVQSWASMPASVHSLPARTA